LFLSKNKVSLLQLTYNKHFVAPFRVPILGWIAYPGCAALRALTRGY